MAYSVKGILQSNIIKNTFLVCTRTRIDTDMCQEKKDNPKMRVKIAYGMIISLPRGKGGKMMVALEDRVEAAGRVGL